MIQECLGFCADNATFPPVLPWRLQTTVPTRTFEPGQMLPAGIVIETIAAVSRGGALYYGHDRTLDRQVAIRSSSDVSLLQDQARAMQSAPAEVATAIYSLGEHDGIPYLVGERVAGRPLTDLVSSHKRTGDVLEIMSRACFALAAVHDARFALGDLTTDTTLQSGERIVFSQFALGQGEVANAVAPIPAERRRDGAHLRNRDVYAMARMTCQLLLGKLDVPRNGAALRDALATVHDMPSSLIALLCEILDVTKLTSFDAAALLSQYRTIRQRMLLDQDAIRVWIAGKPGPTSQRIEQQVLRTDGRVDVSIKGDLSTIEKQATAANVDVIFVSSEVADQPLEVCLNLQNAVPNAKVVYVGGRPSADDISLLYQLGVHRVVPDGPGTLHAIWEVLQERRRKLGRTNRRMIVNG